MVIGNEYELKESVNNESFGVFEKGSKLKLIKITDFNFISMYSFIDDNKRKLDMLLKPYSTRYKKYF